MFPVELAQLESGLCMRAGGGGKGEEAMLGSFFQTRRNPNPKFSGKSGETRQMPLILELVRTLAGWLAGWLTVT